MQAAWGQPPGADNAGGQQEMPLSLPTGCLPDPGALAPLLATTFVTIYSQTVTNREGDSRLLL